MLAGAILGLLGSGTALAAAQGWTATCSSKDDPSAWFVLAKPPPDPKAKDPPKPNTDFICEGLFFDGVACPQVVGIGKVKVEGQSIGGSPTFTLRYIPYGEIKPILLFLDKPGGGVAFAPATTGTSVYDKQPSPSDLLDAWLVDRGRASGLTRDTTLHVWTCPAASFTVPDVRLEELKMQYRAHVGRAPL